MVLKLIVKLSITLVKTSFFSGSHSPCQASFHRLKRARLATSTAVCPLALIASLSMHFSTIAFNNPVIVPGRGSGDKNKMQMMCRKI